MSIFLPNLFLADVSASFISALVMRSLDFSSPPKVFFYPFTILSKEGESFDLTGLYRISSTMTPGQDLTEGAQTFKSWAPVDKYIPRKTPVVAVIRGTVVP